MIYVRFKKLTETAITPTRGSAFAAGFDLYVDMKEPVEVQPGDVVPFYTGISMEIPDGYFGQIHSRSGLSTEHGLVIANGVSVIDSDYRGNVGVPLRNESDIPVMVMPYERVAQIIFQKCPEVVLYETDELTKTERGSKGFGSTGRT